MPKATQLAVSLANKPGSLAKLCSTLGKAQVNITAILAPESRGKAKMRVVVDSTDKAKAALKEARIRFTEEEVILLELYNTPEAFAEIAGMLAESKINIKYAYATSWAGSAKATVVLAVPNVTKALDALGV
jgi:hypothetical protein